MKSFLLKLYTYKFLDDFILVYPVYTIIFKDSGLNTFHIALLLVIWASTGLLLEVPFGVLADKYSRKNLLLIGEIIRAIGYTFWLIGGSFNYFAIGFILWGIKGVLTSGTFEAFVYDELKHHKMEINYEEVNGKLRASKFTGITLAMLMGGFVAEIGYKFVLIPSIIMPLFAGFIIATLKPVAIYKSTEEVKYFQLLKKAINNAKTNPILLRVMVYSVIVIGSYGAGDEYWALVFEDLRITLGIIGILFAIGNSISAVAGYTITYFKNYNNLHISFVFMSALLFIISAYLYVPAVIILIFIATYLLEVSIVRLEAKLQKEIKSNERATITSINNLLVELVAITTSLLIGYFATQIGMVFVLYLVGIILFILSSYYVLINLFIKPSKLL